MDKFRASTSKLTLQDASKKIFDEFETLYELHIKYSKKLLKLEDSGSLPPKCIADAGKTLLTALQLPSSDSNVRALAESTLSTIEAALQVFKQTAADANLQFWRNSCAKISLEMEKFKSPTHLVSLLRDKTSGVPDPELSAEAEQLLRTIHSWVDEQLALATKANTAMDVQAQGPEPAHTAEIKALRAELATFKKIVLAGQQKNEKSGSNPPQQSTKSKVPPQQQQKQKQKQRGRSKSREREPSESRGRSASASSKPRAGDSGKLSRGRSTSRPKQPSRTSR